jgi:hypothetical protein
MKNTYKSLLSLGCFLLSTHLFAQIDSTVIAKKNAVYVQLLGIGGVSVNYDRVFLQKPH